MSLKYEAGEYTVFGDGQTIRLETRQCVHCGGHWVHEPGSGKIRGYCMNCGGFVCGPSCEKCVPTEQYLENVEKGREDDFRPTQIYIPPTASFLK